MLTFFKSSICKQICYTHANAFVLVGLNDWLGVLVEGVQPLLDGINVVVHAAGGLAPVDETSGHGLVADVEVDDLGAGGDLLLELLALFWRKMKMLVKIVTTVTYLLRGRP